MKIFAKALLAAWVALSMGLGVSAQFTTDPNGDALTTESGFELVAQGSLLLDPLDKSVRANGGVTLSDASGSLFLAETMRLSYEEAADGSLTYKLLELAGQVYMDYAGSRGQAELARIELEGRRIELSGPLVTLETELGRLETEGQIVLAVDAGLLSLPGAFFLSQGDTALRGQSLEVQFEPIRENTETQSEGLGVLRSLNAQGPLVFSDGVRQFEAGALDYVFATNTYRLSGGVEGTDGLNRLSAEQVEFNATTEELTLDGS